MSPIFAWAGHSLSDAVLAFPGQLALPTLEQIINLNATNGTFLPLEDIQGDILYVKNASCVPQNTALMYRTQGGDEEAGGKTRLLPDQ